MSEYTPTTEEIREYIETGGEPRPWVELDEAEEAREKARGEAFDRWLAAHDAEVRASVVPEIGMPCADTKPHPPHAWQMSATGWCLCAGVVTEEPEWEYEVTYSSASAPSIDGYRMRRSSGILPSLAMVAEWMGFSQNAIAHRRTKAVPAGEWERVPVKQEGAEIDG